jgi:phage-related protein (TIGR01555 family)
MKKNLMTKLFKRFDGFRDPSNDRGGTKDITRRLVGGFENRTAEESDKLYHSNGFMKKIVREPAEDATREWFTIETNLDTEDENFSRMIQNRLQELDFQRKLKEMIARSRRHQMGSFLYYGVKGSVAQTDLSKPLFGKEKLDYLNLVHDPEIVAVTMLNRYDPTKKDYLKPEFQINGLAVHESRISWLVNDFDVKLMRGQTPLDTSYDSVIAQDSALWSVSKLMTDIVTKIFKSSMFVGLAPGEKIEFLEKMKHYMETNGVVALQGDEDFQKMVYTFTGIKDIFDFIFDNLSGVSGIPKNILIGKAHGVVTAGEFDTLNYYAEIAKLQENELTPIVKKTIDMIIGESEGAISSSKGTREMDYEIKWNPLWKLDPVSQADTDLKGSQRDQIDVTIGKASPDEVRRLDERYSELEADPMEEMEEILNMDEPPIPAPVVEDPGDENGEA